MICPKKSLYKSVFRAYNTQKISGKRRGREKRRGSYDDDRFAEMSERRQQGGYPNVAQPRQAPIGGGGGGNTAHLRPNHPVMRPQHPHQQGFVGVEGPTLPAPAPPPSRPRLSYQSRPVERASSSAASRSQAIPDADFFAIEQAIQAAEMRAKRRKMTTTPRVVTSYAAYGSPKKSASLPAERPGGGGGHQQRPTGNAANQLRSGPGPAPGVSRGNSQQQQYHQIQPPVSERDLWAQADMARTMHKPSKEISLHGAADLSMMTSRGGGLLKPNYPTSVPTTAQRSEGVTFWNKPEPPRQQSPLKSSIQATLKLVGNGERFGVYIGGKNDTFELHLRRIASDDCRWDKNSKTWTFPLQKHELVVSSLRNSKEFRCKVEPLHPFALRMVQGHLQNKCTDEEIECIFQNVPEHLQKKLMEFQTEGVRYIIKLRGRGLIGDEMGLGKTVQALAVAAAYKDSWPCLIVTPSSLKIQWADAIHEWLRQTEEHVSIVSNGKDTKSLNNRFVVISYDFIPKMSQQLAEKKFQMIILDEAHYIKNHKAKRSKEALPLIQKAKHAVLLTGTPALSRPIELLQQLRAIHPTLVRSIKEFGDRYCKGGRFYNPHFPGAMYNGASNLKELHQVVTTTTMIRRLKKDVLSQLPSKIRQQILLPSTSAEQKVLKKITDQVEELKEDHDGNFDAIFGQHQKINELYLKSGEIKAKAVCDYLNVLLEAEQKFLIFGHHKCVLNAIESHLREKKVKLIRIDGSTPSVQRAGLVQKFQENEVYRAAVLSIKAAGVGLTLTAASLVVMAELDWTPGNLVQAEDRAHRIGQASSVHVHYLHMKGSIDDIIWQTIQTKLQNVGTVLDGSVDKLELAKEN